MEPPTFKCQHCASATAIEPLESPAICPECCVKRGEHEFEYDREFCEHRCIHCDDSAPPDFYACDDDVGCAPYGPARSESVGTPISQLSGRPGEQGFAEFCRIAASWGFA